MNKAELIDAVTARVGDKRTATAAVEAVLAVVQRTVTGGEKVALSGFGVFEKVDRAARTARNPATGAAVQLAATSVPRFRPGQGFRDVVSGARELAAEPDAPVAALATRAPVVRRTAPAAVQVAALAETALEAPVKIAVRAATAPAKAAVRAVKTATAPAKQPAPARKATATKAPTKAPAAKKAPKTVAPAKTKGKATVGKATAGKGKKDAKPAGKGKGKGKKK